MKQSQMQHKSWLQLQRFQEYELEKKKYLEKEQEQRFKSQEFNLKQKPTNWIGDIHERQTLLQKAKWKWIEEQKKLLDEKKEILQLQGATFHPQILNKMNRNRTPEQFYKDNISYKTKTEQSVQRLKKQLEEKDKNRNSYSPVINKKSEQLVVLPFYDRMQEKQLEKEQNLLKIKKSTTPSFSPQLYSRNFQSRQINQAMIINNYNSTQGKKLDLENVVIDQKSFTFFEDLRKQQNPEKSPEMRKKQITLTENHEILNISPQATVKKQERSLSPYKSIVSKTTQKNYFKK